MSRLLILAALSSVALLSIVPACSGKDEENLPLNTGADSSSDEVSGDASDDGGLGVDFGTMCPAGTPCGTGGVCSTAGTCCEPAASACGDKCCGGGQICYAGACVTPGKVCRNVDDCADGETCDPSLGGGDAGAPPTCGDAAPSTLGRCVPRPPT